MTLATTTGAAAVKAPYPIHNRAAATWTASIVLDRRTKYEAENTAVATQPIASITIGLRA
jgi:hypothetical protein